MVEQIAILVHYLSLLRTEDNQSNHYVFLQATVEDDLDRDVCQEVLGDCEVINNDGTVDIEISCYRKKWRDRLLCYPRNIGAEDTV